MDAIYQRGRATALEVIEGIDDPPSYSAIRALLAILERKGHVKHVKEGAKYVYLPAHSRKAAAQTAVKRLVQTFFEDSPELGISAILEVYGRRFSADKVKRISALVKDGSTKGKK